MASRAESSNAWKVQPYSFLLHYTQSNLTGQFITTMWYNSLVQTSEAIHYVILCVPLTLSSEEKSSIITELNNYHTSEYVIFKGIYFLGKSERIMF